MDLQSTLLSALDTYGLPAIFVSIYVAAVGVPLPTSFLLLFAGSLVANGDLEYWPVVIVSTVGAVLGDHTGFAMGWWGGRPLTEKLSQRLKMTHLLEKVEGFFQRWGASSIFFSRWLVSEFGPSVNVVSGMTRYQLPRFSALVIAGETVWVLAYVQVGQYFSASIAEVSEALGDFAWVIVGVGAVGVLGYLLYQNLRGARPAVPVAAEPELPALAEPPEAA